MKTTVKTTPFEDQQPGTSGLRKQTRTFMTENYTENFVQSILSVATPTTLLVGGDGRFFSPQVIQTIIKMSRANNVSKVLVAKDGILSTPAASLLIRSLRLSGAILLTASHNPGGLDADFGIKYNMDNGGPAISSLTSKIYDYSKSISFYEIYQMDNIPLDVVRDYPMGPFSVHVIDSITPYVHMMHDIFDFDAIRLFCKSPNFSFLFDGMHAVTGPYAHQIFVKDLQLPPSSIMNGIPKPDFGNGHPDPNLTYANELVNRVESQNISFGAASDGDGDRNMIIGKNVFVNPSDSVAVIAANASCIPYFAKHGVKGLARSMPTSGALDHVAAARGLELYQTPTGWKFFGNLMDADKLSICGEESFGTGSDHIREKDGLWAILGILISHSLAPNTS
jgi:phosphoglucomutase